MNALNTKHNRSYNPSGPVAYFITFRTYGTWLHGDKRGSMGRRTAHTPGAPTLKPNTYRQGWEQRQLKHSAIYFNSIQRSLIDHVIREVIKTNQWQLHVLDVQGDHVHVVLTALKRPEAVMNSLKSWCTRELRKARCISNEIKPWSRHGSTRWLWTEDELREACVYVTREVISPS
jgi:REP element-mobilizing transposase RayT